MDTVVTKEMGPIPFGPNHALRNMEPAQRLFRHKLHPEWGVGLWVREEMTRRRLRFDDGEMRAFKQGFYHLLEPIDVDVVDVEAKFEEIGSEHDLATAERRRARLRKQKAPVMALAQQVRVFRHSYPDGFADPAFIDDHVRPSGGRSRKSHHGEAVDLARQLLAADVLGELAASGDWAAIHAAAVQVMASTTLVSRSKGYTPVAALDGDARDAFGKALFELLHGDEERYAKRFAAWLATLRKDCKLKPEWGLASLFPALMSPTEHVVVRPRAFELQAREILPGKVIEKRPSKQGYKRARRVAKRLAKRLGELGLDTPDLLHARVFIWETLRPRSRELLAELEG